MRLGLGLSLSNVQGGVSVYDPAELTLTGWWRASWTASPWVGTASAGDSGSRNLEEATNQPGTSAIGSRTAADFDGTNDKLTSMAALPAISNYLGAAAGSGWALFWADAAAAPGAGGYADPQFFGDSGTYFSLSFTTSGVRVEMYNTGNAGAGFGADRKSVAVACGTGAWHLAQFRYNNAQMEVRVDGGSWSTVSGLGPQVRTSPLQVGTNFSASAFFNGKMADLGLASSYLSNDNFDDILSYVNGRYGLTLT